MSKRINSILIVFLSLLAVPVMAQEGLYRIKVENFEELKEYFRPDHGKPVILSGHRGGMLPSYPENSIEALEKTLSITPSFFEIDPRLTKDSVIVLMHDRTLDRTTNFSGDISNYTYEELKEARLLDRQGNLTDYRIPTLKETLDWGRDKTIFNLDNKEIPWELYVDLFKSGDYPNIVLSVRSMEEATYYYERLDEVMLCIAIQDQEQLEAFEKTGIPFDRVIAYVGLTMKPEQQQLYDYLRAQGSMIFVSIHPTQDRKKGQERLEGYIEELMKKPDIIETDYPAYFLGINQ